MKRILIKKIITNFIIIGIIVFALFSIINYIMLRDRNYYDLQEMLDQVTYFYNKNDALSLTDTQEETTLLEEKQSLIDVLQTIPTVYEKAIFAFDQTTGELLGSTIYNEQTFNIAGIDDEAERLEVLKNTEDGKLLKVNGSYKFVKAKTTNQILLVAYRQANQTFYSLALNLFYFMIIIIAIFIMFLYILNQYFQKYIFNDFENIQENIKKLMLGDYSTDFSSTYDTELKPLANILNDWKNSYRHKSERMNQMVSTLDSNIAAFECIDYINKNFFSDKVQLFLGLEEDEWENIGKTPASFETYIEKIKETADEEGIIYLHSKYIQIQTFKIEHEFYGIIYDKTKDIIENKEISDQLREVRADSERDSLTQLYNRKGLESKVKESLETYPESGIMMIFDLDNFKLINDTLGHPEGDKVLKMMADCLVASFRKGTVIARLGGDEFVAFFSNPIAEDVLTERLTDILNNVRSHLGFYYDHYQVSTSVGVAYVDKHITTYENLYQYADLALYRAKKNGKNSFYIYQHDVKEGILE